MTLTIGAESEGGSGDEGEGRDDAADGATPPFTYAVHRVAVALPSYAGRARRGDDYYGRLEVHLSSGGQGYDVMGYSTAQIIGDVLDQYERYLEFLRLSHPVGNR